MLLRFFKSNQAYHFFVIPLMVLALWSRSYLWPVSFPFFEGENQMPLYQPVQLLLGGPALAGTVASMVIVVLLSFLILRMNTVYAFIRIRTFLPSNIFIFIISGLMPLHTMHPVYFGCLFLLLATDRIFGAYEKSQSIYGNVFDAGLLIGVGSLFYFNLIFFFPVIWIGLLLIWKSPGWRSFVLPVTGVALPWLFAFSYYFFTDNINELAITINQNMLTPNYLLRNDRNLQVFLGFLIFLILLGSFFLLGQIDEKKISTRKYFQIFFVIFLIAMVLLLAVPAVSFEILVVMAAPLTFLISNYLIFMRSRFLGNVILYLFLGIVIYLQFM